MPMCKRIGLVLARLQRVGFTILLLWAEELLPVRTVLLGRKLRDFLFTKVQAKTAPATPILFGWICRQSARLPSKVRGWHFASLPITSGEISQ